MLHSNLAVTRRISSYGAFARTLLVSACKLIGEEVHILLDTYDSDCLKAQERELRGNSEETYVISGSEQQGPRASIASLMKNISFKSELCKFLITEWQEQKYANIIGTKIVYVSHGGSCVRLWVRKNLLLKERTNANILKLTLS